MVKGPAAPCGSTEAVGPAALSWRVALV